MLSEQSKSKSRRESGNRNKNENVGIGVVVLMTILSIAMAATAQAGWRLSTGIGGAEDLADFYIGAQNLSAELPYEFGGWIIYKGVKPELERKEQQFTAGLYGKILTSGTIGGDNPVPIFNQLFPVVNLRPYFELRLSLVDEIDVAPSLGTMINDFVWVRGTYVNEIFKGTDLQADNDSDYIIGLGATFEF